MILFVTTVNECLYLCFFFPSPLFEVEVWELILISTKEVNDVLFKDIWVQYIMVNERWKCNGWIYQQRTETGYIFCTFPQEYFLNFCSVQPYLCLFKHLVFAKVLRGIFYQGCGYVVFTRDSYVGRCFKGLGQLTPTSKIVSFEELKQFLGIKLYVSSWFMLEKECLYMLTLSVEYFMLCKFIQYYNMDYYADGFLKII